MKKYPLRGTYSAVARKLKVQRATVQQQYERGNPKYTLLVEREIERRLERARRLFGDKYMELIESNGVKNR